MAVFLLPMFYLTLGLTKQKNTHAPSVCGLTRSDSAGRTKIIAGLSAGPRFDSRRNPVNSNQHGFEHIDPQVRILNY